MECEGGEKHPWNQAGTGRLSSAHAAHPVKHVSNVNPDGMDMVQQPFKRVLESDEDEQKRCILVTDVTIKEEPLELEDSKDFSLVLTEEIPEGGTLQDMPGKCEVRKVEMLHSRKRLRCPRCPTSFIHGPHGAGLGMLVGHIYIKHEKLRVSTLSAARRRYSALVKDAVGKGYLRTCSGLLLPSD